VHTKEKSIDMWEKGGKKISFYNHKDITLIKRKFRYGANIENKSDRLCIKDNKYVN
jgi:hypothetical protein